MSSRKETNCSGNISIRCSIDLLAVCAVAQSCWNQTSGFPTSLKFGSRMIYIPARCYCNPVDSFLKQNVSDSYTIFPNCPPYTHSFAVFHETFCGYFPPTSENSACWRSQRNESELYHLWEERNNILKDILTACYAVFLSRVPAVTELPLICMNWTSDRRAKFFWLIDQIISKLKYISHMLL